MSANAVYLGDHVMTRGLFGGLTYRGVAIAVKCPITNRDEITVKKTNGVTERVETSTAVALGPFDGDYVETGGKR